MLTQLEYEPVAVQAPDEVKYLRKVEAHMLAVINQFGITGLAAPQLGFSIQMVVVRLADGARLTLLNPVIERMYGAETDYPESCISCPPGGNQCEVARMQFITVVAASIEKPNEQVEWRFTSSDARVVQHEVDHLAGTFFFDRANLVEKSKVIERFHLWQRTFKQNGTGLPFKRGGQNGRHTSTPA